MSRLPTAPSASPAPLGRRMGAYAIDLALQTVLLGIAAGATGVIVLGGAAPRTPTDVLGAVGVVYGVVAVVALAWLVVYTLLQGGRGSIGQRLVGVRLADVATGAAIGFGRALLRNIVWGLAGAIVVGYFSPLFDRSARRQGWHDRAAHAFVADARPAAEYVPLPPPAAPRDAVSSPAPPPLTPDGAPDFHTTAVVAPRPRFVADSDPGAGAEVPSPTLISSVPGIAHRGSEPGAAAAASGPTIIEPFDSTVKTFSRGRRGTADPVTPVAASGSPSTNADASDPDAPGVDPLDSTVKTFARAARDAEEVAEQDAESSAALDETRAKAPDVDHTDRPPRSADADETVAAVPRRRAIIAFTWDTGERVAVYGTTLFGRNPAAEDGAAVVAVRDETLSLSKTHFEVGSGADGAWILDRHSTNGTVLVRSGIRTPLVPGDRTVLRPGDRVEFGDRSLQVGDAP